MDIVYNSCFPTISLVCKEKLEPPHEMVQVPLLLSLSLSLFHNFFSRTRFGRRPKFCSINRNFDDRLSVVPNSVGWPDVRAAG